jgi:hypothetical protein
MNFPTDRTLDPAAKWAGYAGLLPQIAAALLVLAGGEWRWTGLALAYGYAILIFSFLGGIWWGFGLVARKPDVAAGRIFAMAVLPSLIALASYMPWIFGFEWPGPSMAWIGIFIMLSPVVDRWLAARCILPDGWLAMRWRLSLGLGGLTFGLALFA